MVINVKKTKAMVASKKQEIPKISICLDGTAIEEVQKNGLPGKYNNRRW